MLDSHHETLLPLLLFCPVVAHLCPVALRCMQDRFICFRKQEINEAIAQVRVGDAKALNIVRIVLKSVNGTSIHG